MTNFALWPGGPVMEKSRDAAPIGTDSVVLADFVRITGKKRGLDMGTGSGILALLLLERLPGVTMTLVDIVPEAADLARRNMALNGLTARAEVICGDLRQMTGPFDFIITNPPYYPVTGGKSPDDNRAKARDEGLCTLPELCGAAARLLKNGGKFYMVYPVSRMAEAFCELSGAGLEPKRLRLVQGRADTPPSVFLAECARGGKRGMTAEPTLVLKNPDGADTAEVKRIYHLGE